MQHIDQQEIMCNLLKGEIIVYFQKIVVLDNAQKTVWWFR